MTTRDLILGTLDAINEGYQELIELVNNTPDQEIEYCLKKYFVELGTFIFINLSLMRMTITKTFHEEDSGNNAKMSNEEIEKYIRASLNHFLSDFNIDSEETSELFPENNSIC